MAETVVFIDAAGVTHDLNSGEGVDRCAPDGMQGRFMPPLSVTEVPIPGEAGSVLDTIRFQPKEVTVPYSMLAVDETTLRSDLREFVRSLNPLPGLGRLRNTAVDGRIRDLFCCCVDGLGLDESWGSTRLVGRNATRRRALQRVVLVFRAFDPYWYDIASQTVLFSETSQTVKFFPILPLRFANSQLFIGDSTLGVQGDVDAWPVWTLTGPGDNWVVRNLTTGDSFAIDYALNDGETIVIDTRPGAKTVTGLGGVNLFAALGPSPVMWPLNPGTLNLAVEATGTSPDTSVGLEYTPRWLSP